MANVSISTGRFTAAQVDLIARPRSPRPGPVCVYLHSAASNATEANGVGLPDVQDKVRAIVDKIGLTVVAPTQPLTFGNGAAADTGASTCQGVLTDAIAYHKANLGGTSAPVVLIGSSMGSTTALRRAGLDPTNVACVVTFLTVGCLRVAVDNDMGGNAAAINTAYGGSVTTDEDPSTMADTVAKFLTHGATDAYSTTSGHVLETEYAARGASFVSVASQGHVTAAIAGVSTADAVAFIRAHI